MTDITYRKLDSNGDYTFGQGSGNFLKNSPDAVAQAVKTRLGLVQGEWFLDVTAGVPYDTKILGHGNISTYDETIKDVILGTIGVQQILDYASQINPTSRAVFISCKIQTIYGSTTVTATL